MDTSTSIIKIIICMAIICGIVYLQYKTNIIWKVVGKVKWHKLQPELQNIRDIHARTTGEGKKIKWLEKATKKVKKEFDNSKHEYVEYIDFCKRKHLDLPVNQAEVENLIDITEDALLNPSEALDKELRCASEEYDETYELVNVAGENLLAQRQETVDVIEDVEELVNSIAYYPKEFKTDINTIAIQKEKFNTALDYGIEQSKVMEASAKGVGAGVVAGATVARLAPNAAMWVATTFGTASTGTAISALNGAAATNAALAWLGGGATAIGGGGVAAGRALLSLAGPVGWGMAGTSIAVSVFFAWRKKHKLREDKKYQIALLKRWTEILKESKGKIDSISIETETLFRELQNLLLSCSYLNGCEYTLLSKEQKLQLGTLVNNTKALSALLNETIE